MPDLTQAIAWTCSSNIDWSTTVTSSRDPGTTYTVRWGRTPGAHAQYEWSCTCPGFTHRRMCRHVKEVLKDDPRCRWNAECDPSLDPERGDGIDDAGMHCPECNAPAEPVMVAT